MIEIIDFSVNKTRHQYCSECILYVSNLFHKFIHIALSFSETN